MKAKTPWLCSFRRIPTHSLPIFAVMDGDRAVFYAPRMVCVLDGRDGPATVCHIKHLASEPSRGKPLFTVTQSVALQAANRIIQAARDASSEMIEASRLVFTPECLTLYVNNGCNMRCRYCYSQPDANKEGTVSVEGVRSAARLVSGSCAERNSPFTLAIHGGGEPTLDTRHVDRILDIVRVEASRVGVHLHTYIATNGAVSDDAARWLATQFDLVGVSCDGPPEVQDIQRPGLDGEPLSEYVYRTMSILRQHGRPFHTRVTVSRDTVDRQAEIVSYLADRYAPNEIRMEPVYVNPSGEPPLGTSQAAAFVSGFLAAQTAGAAWAIPVTTSITRPDAVYGPYCNVLRRVLNLVPGDVATGCFLDSRPDNVARRGVQTGSFDSKLGVFRLDTERIRFLINRCSDRPTGCLDCLCSYQCTYGCPDRCMLSGAETSPSREGEKGSFRCMVNRMLLERMILEASDHAWACTPPGHCQEMRDAQRMINVAVYRNGHRDEITP